MKTHLYGIHHDPPTPPTYYFPYHENEGQDTGYEEFVSSLCTGGVRLLDMTGTVYGLLPY